MRWSHIFKDAMCWSADDTPSAFFWDLPPSLCPRGSCKNCRGHGWLGRHLSPAGRDVPSQDLLTWHQRNQSAWYTKAGGVLVFCHLGSSLQQGRGESRVRRPDWPGVAWPGCAQVAGSPLPGLTVALCPGMRLLCERPDILPPRPPFKLFEYVSVIGNQRSRS